MANVWSVDYNSRMLSFLVGDSAVVNSLLFLPNGVLGFCDGSFLCGVVLNILSSSAIILLKKTGWVALLQ